MSEEIGQAREAQLSGKFFKSVLEKGGSMLRHWGTLDSGLTIVRRILMNHPLALQIQSEMVEQNKDISQTAAGEELNRDLQKLIKKHTEEIKQLRTEMEGNAFFTDNL